MSLLTTMSRLRTQNGWPSAVDDLLREVVHDGFAFHICGKRLDPLVLVASYHWENYVDLLTITESDLVTAARAIRGRDFDVFGPRSVVWAYGNDAEPTIRALLTLKHPDHPDHPTRPYDSPRSMAVPAELRRPLTFKAPEPWRAGNRTRRLGAALASELAEMAAVGLLADGTTLAEPSMSSTQPNPGSVA